jgi:hypothetical protein
MGKKGGNKTNSPQEIPKPLFVKRYNLEAVKYPRENI